MKGVINEGHIPVNNWQLLVIGGPPLTIIEQSGFEDELKTVTLPDQTVATGGTRNPVEFDITMPAHHTAEQVFMEAWFLESQDPVSPTYKKVATSIDFDIHGEVARTWSLIGLFPKKRVTSDKDMNDDGEMATVVWTMSADDQLPI